MHIIRGGTDIIIIDGVEKLHELVTGNPRPYQLEPFHLLQRWRDLH